MADQYYRYCKDCKHKVVGHAFSEGECTLCEKDISCSHTPCDPVCRECSVEQDVCMSCGDTLGWKPEVWDFEKHSDEPYLEVKPKEIIEYFPGEEKTAKNIRSITTIQELTANEILDQYKDYLDPTAEEMLLGHISRNLVLDREYKAKGTWHDVLRYAENMGKEKQMLEALILQFFHELKKAKLNWIREDHWKDTTVEDKVQEIITSYEKHFNITTQRHGDISGH